MNKFTNFFNSFKYAFTGIFSAFLSERNVKVHFIATIAVIILGFLLNISITKWCILIILIGIVISMEMINTSIEILCNEICSSQNAQIKKIKDISAGAVLVVAISAFLVGLLIFGHKIIHVLF